MLIFDCNNQIEQFIKKIRIKDGRINFKKKRKPLQVDERLNSTIVPYEATQKYKQSFQKFMEQSKARNINVWEPKKSISPQPSPPKKVFNPVLDQKRKSQEKSILETQIGQNVQNSKFSFSQTERVQGNKSTETDSLKQLKFPHQKHSEYSKMPKHTEAKPSKAPQVQHKVSEHRKNEESLKQVIHSQKNSGQQKNQESSHNKHQAQTNKRDSEHNQIKLPIHKSESPKQEEEVVKEKKGKVTSSDQEKQGENEYEESFEEEKGPENQIKEDPSQIKEPETERQKSGEKAKRNTEGNKVSNDGDDQVEEEIQ